ncbi:MAG TPA: HAD family hydrolase [Trueperaceae bacterium]|nr:HAD family hydrolase [Trueperaceae bacterium]
MSGAHRLSGAQDTRSPRTSRDSRPAFGFDLDGVLIVNPFDTCVVPRLERLLSASPSLAHLGDAEVSKRVRGAIRRGWQQRMATGDLAAAYDWDAIYIEAAEELLAPIAARSAVDVGLWVRECCAQGGHIRALPGAAEMLSRLSAAGARLVVISNGYAPYQEPVLESLGLLGYFDEVVTPDRVGYAKPDVRIFEAAGHLDAFVGDTLVHDILGARQARIDAVWVHPSLPPALAALGPRERAAGTHIASLVHASLSASAHTRFHPEADLDSCRPDAVVTAMSEVADLLLDTYGPVTAQQ